MRSSIVTAERSCLPACVRSTAPPSLLRGDPSCESLRRHRQRVTMTPARARGKLSRKAA